MAFRYPFKSKWKISSRSYRMRFESRVQYQLQGPTDNLSDDMNVQAGRDTDVELGSFTTPTLTQDCQVRLLDISNPWGEERVIMVGARASWLMFRSQMSTSSRVRAHLYTHV